MEDAANWVIRMRYEAPDEKTQHEFAQWLNCSDTHAQAWAQAERVLGTFDRLPPAIGRQALKSTLENRRRRTVLRAALSAAVIAPVVIIGARPTLWRTWTAHARTATGERRSLALDDGTQLVLNTGSAVDIVFTQTERRVILHAGEILVSTAQEKARAYRPFIVATRHGDIRALGTRYIVRESSAHTTVSVLEHAVRIHPQHAQSVQLGAGETTVFDTQSVGRARTSPPGTGLWERGMFVAHDMRLEDLLAELSRYRPGVLRCTADVADLRVTAALSLDDTDAALAMLAQTLPLRIKRISPYWITVKAA